MYVFYKNKRMRVRYDDPLAAKSKVHLQLRVPMMKVPLINVTLYRWVTVVSLPQAPYRGNTKKLAAELLQARKAIKQLRCVGVWKLSLVRGCEWNS